MTTDGEIERQERIARALESIAASLHKIAHPTLIRQTDGTVCAVPTVAADKLEALSDWALSPIVREGDTQTSG